MNELSILSRDDEAARERLAAAAGDMVARTRTWAAINTGSHNIAGLKTLAPILADAFSALDADIRLVDGPGFDSVGADGKVTEIHTGPIVEVAARPDAPVQVVMSGHYDTVFPPGTFEAIRDLDNGQINGPGMADMKGGLSLMLEALRTFEAGPLRDRLGYRIVITPDEEIGNFASAGALTAAARSGAHIGMTYEPAMETGAMSGGRKGSAVFDIVLHGRAAHAGRAKEEGRSAIEAAAELVVALEALNGKRDGVTFNVGAIEGGSPVNIVPDLAVVRFGARAPDAEASAWATAQVQRLFEKASARDGIHGHLHGGFYRPPKPRNAAQQALFDAVHATGQAIGLDLEFIDTGGVCEGNNIFAAGVPNVDTLGVRGGRIHSNEEFVITESFPERALLSALILNRLADGRLDGRRIRDLMGQGG
ncbi:MAG: hydrolase [Hyphomonas sp.]